MLVVSRKVGETLRISDDITVTVMRITGNRVRLGIEAPCETVIQRGELDRLPRPNDLDDADGCSSQSPQDRL